MPAFRPWLFPGLLTILAAIFWLTAPSGAGLNGKGATAEDQEKKAPGPGLLATIPEDEAGNDGCPGQPINCEDLVIQARIDEPGDRDNYSITVEAGVCLTVGTLVDSLEPNTDTVIEILNSDCSQVLISDDDNGPDTFSLIPGFRVPAAGTYVVRVRHFLDGGTGAYRLFARCSPGGGANATCETAVLLECGTSTLTGTTDCTGNEYNPRGPITSCTQFSAAGQDVVYKVDAVQGSTITLTYQSTADGSLYILKDCAAPVDSCVAGADATREGGSETLAYAVPRTGTYYIILDSFGSMTSGDWSLEAVVDCSTPVEAATWGQIKARYVFRESGH